MTVWRYHIRTVGELSSSRSAQFESLVPWQPNSLIRRCAESRYVTAYAVGTFAVLMGLSVWINQYTNHSPMSSSESFVASVLFGFFLLVYGFDAALFSAVLDRRLFLRTIKTFDLWVIIVSALLVGLCDQILLGWKLVSAAKALLLTAGSVLLIAIQDACPFLPRKLRAAILIGVCCYVWWLWVITVFVEEERLYNAWCVSFGEKRCESIMSIKRTAISQQCLFYAKFAVKMLRHPERGVVLAAPVAITRLNEDEPSVTAASGFADAEEEQTQDDSSAASSQRHMSVSMQPVLAAAREDNKRNKRANGDLRMPLLQDV